MPTLRPYQQKLEDDIDAAWAAGHQNVMAIAPTGAGKCLGRGTPVMLYDGSVAPVETIRVGDLLMGPDSKPRRVTSTTTGRERMYRIVPTKGDPYEVNESHILSLKLTPDRHGVPPSVVNLSVPEYLASNKTFLHRAKGWRAAVDFPSNVTSFPIPPYMLGVWLGDGTSRHFSVTTGDPEIVQECLAYAKSIGHTYRIEPNSPGSIVVHLIEHGVRAGRRGCVLTNHLKSLGVRLDKHVPHAYRTASRGDRLELLAGVLDTDGYWSGKGYQLTFKSERLLDDVIFVARSLGFAAYKKTVRKKCHNNGVVGTYFSCSINGPVDEIPCRVARLKAPPRLQKKDVLVTGIRVEAIGEGDYFGFELSGPDRLFLLGDFTVTHNTVLFTNILARERGASAAIAHRRELVTQMSLALARNGVRHRVIGPKSVARTAAGIHIDELGRSYIDPHARCGVVGIDSLEGLNPRDPWLSQVQTWVGDEGHHFLRENKWGRGVAMFPNARGLLVTATGFRSDGNGLGRGVLLPNGKWSNDGIADEMVLGPTMGDLIRMGYLTPYDLACPPSDIDYSEVPVTPSGELSQSKLRAVVHKSTRIVGDVVEHYLRLAPGKLGVTFAVDVEAAIELANAYKAKGVPAEVITAKTPDMLRQRILARFKRREVLQLVNVDLFGEGFDLPAIEVVSMVRKTESKGLFDQQFGRALRLMIDDAHAAHWDAYTDEQRRALIASSRKPKALIIDHVGNVVRHKPPDAFRFHTLDRRERRAKPKPGDEIPLTTCLAILPGGYPCAKPYPRDLPACPYCGGKPDLTPAQRRAPEFVDGDLVLLDEEALAKLRGDVDRIDRAVQVPPNLSGPAQQHLRNVHYERQVAQGALRAAMALWAGRQKHEGCGDSQIQRRFFHVFGIDVLSAQALSKADAEALRQRVEERNLLDGTVSSE